MGTVPELDLNILEGHNNKLLIVGDSSYYPSNWNISTPTLQITPPSFPTTSFEFTPRGVQVYNSYTLGITCVDDQCSFAPLPDGIYYLKYTIYPFATYFIEKNFLRIDAFMAKFDEAYLKLDIIQCDRSNIRQAELLFSEIEMYINGAVAAANQCALKLAMELYTKADKLLDNYINNQ